ncbi:MAG: NIL domain-containing protein [Deltaproteobacteria bacterium]|nr:NIL domain-containing protein [Deltaproteobacteria bacterium]
MPRSSSRGKKKGETRKFYLTYPQKLIRKPLIYELIKRFDLVVNIRNSSVTEEVGLIAVELSGPSGAIEKGVQWLRSEGVQVDPIEQSIVEG